MGIMDLPITFGRNGYGCVESLVELSQWSEYIEYKITVFYKKVFYEKVGDFYCQVGNEGIYFLA